MKSTRARFIVVGILVCVFAIGMATFLNYFKYQGTLKQIVQTRLLVVAGGIENSIQSALGVGMSFAEIPTLPALLARERGADPLISGIDVFDPGGRILYSTAAERVGTHVPATWLAMFRREGAGEREWIAARLDEPVTGLAVRNNFDLTIGHVAVRYSRAGIEANLGAMARHLMLIAALAAVVSAIVVVSGLMLVFGRFERDMRAAEARVAGGEPSPALPPSLAATVDTVRDAIDDAERRIEQAVRLPTAAG